MGRGIDYITVVIPKRVLVKIYDSVIGQIAVVESDSQYEQLQAGCRLRERGFRLYSEYLYPEVSEQIEAWCSGRPVYIKGDEFDLYVACKKPHPVFGCKVVGHIWGHAYLQGDNVVIGAALNGKSITIYNGVKNIFGETPKGEPLGEALISWTLTQNEKGEYDRYLIDFMVSQKMGRYVAGLMTVLSNGDVVEMYYYRDD